MIFSSTNRVYSLSLKTSNYDRKKLLINRIKDYRSCLISKENKIYNRIFKVFYENIDRLFYYH